MRGRLFWKILIFFWLTFMAILEGMWVVVAFYGTSRKPIDVVVAQRIAHLQMATATAVLEREGIEGLRATMAAWPANERRLLAVDLATVKPALPQAAASKRLPPLVATVRAPDSVTYQLKYDTGALRAEFRPPRPFHIPLDLVVFGLIGGLMFSAALAWYLTKPIQRLHDGFAQLAQGRLGVRLSAHMGRRRDELADLARDFDLMAERLQQLIASREHLLHAVSHELRSPLARLHLAVGLALQNPQRLSATLDRIELEVKRLDGIVGEFLTLARAEAGPPQLQDYLDLSSLALTVANDARFEAQSSGVLVDTNLEQDSQEGLPTVKGNAELLRRALENVVRNALQHSAPGQTVRIEVIPDWAAHYFVIKISDEGPGMEPEVLDALFEPFVRGQSRIGGQGFGLGLTIAQRVVLAHGGSIQAQNRPGRGVIVTICLPFGPLGNA